MKNPDYCLHLKVSHKKITRLAKLKKKARLKWWSWRVAAWAVVSSSSCWAISTTCHCSPTEEATKCSSNCSWPWSGIRRGGSPNLSPALYRDGEWVKDRATSKCQFPSYNVGLDLQANAPTRRLFRPHFHHSPVPNTYDLHSSDQCPPLYCFTLWEVRYTLRREGKARPLQANPLLPQELWIIETSPCCGLRLPSARQFTNRFVCMVIENMS